MTLVGCDSEEVTIVTAEEALEIANFENAYVGLRDLYFNEPQDITQEITISADELIYFENGKYNDRYVSYLYISEDSLYDGLREYLYTLFNYERMIEGDERVASGQDRDDHNFYINFLCSYVGGSIYALEYFYNEFEDFYYTMYHVYYAETGTIFFSAADGNIYSSETVLTTLFADELDDMRNEVEELIASAGNWDYMPYITYVHSDELVDGYQDIYDNYSYAMYDRDTLEAYYYDYGYYGIFVGRSLEDVQDDILFSRAVKYHVDDTGDLVPYVIYASNANDAEQPLQESYPYTIYISYD